jgi:hypothetical protein
VPSKYPSLKFSKKMIPISSVIDLCSFGASKAETKASTHTTVSSVQMLAVQLQFGVRSEVKMLPSFLKCFPRVETLVVEVTPSRSPFIDIRIIITILHKIAAA